jgi:hypothetical protein
LNYKVGKDSNEEAGDGGGDSTLTFGSGTLVSLAANYKVDSTENQNKNKTDTDDGIKIGQEDSKERADSGKDSSDSTGVEDITSPNVNLGDEFVIHKEF